ncbi:hypothetical protein [Paenibacillus nasutitermitis]|nr:hypothetical protein [Paenibacillus nasutitermitis]
MNDRRRSIDDERIHNTCRIYPMIWIFYRLLQTDQHDHTIGLYIQGSVAFDGFPPQRSDIDLIVVLAQPARDADLGMIDG